MVVEIGKKNGDSWSIVRMAAAAAVEDTTTAATISTQGSGKFLIFSDVHYDPFYGTSDAYSIDLFTKCSQRDAPSFSTYGCESNYNLVQSTLANAAKFCPNPDFILCTGDMTRHGADRTEAATQSTVDQAFHLVLSQLLPHYFPNVSVLALPPLDLGNNDFESDYHLDITSLQPCWAHNDTTSLPNATNAWLSNIAHTFQSQFISEQEEAIFACGGYLSREVIPGLHIIILNTLLWSDALISNNYDRSALSQDGMDPFGQHVWLEQELTYLRQLGKRAYITGHIPPIAISYYPYEGNPLLFESHSRRYHATISMFPDVIAGQFFGHTHSNELRVSSTLPADSPPIILIGAVSPIYGNDPGFSVITYQKNYTDVTAQQQQQQQQLFVPLDLITYHLNLKDPTIIIDDNNNSITIAEFQPLFPSLLQFLNMSNLTNGQVWDLSGRLVTDSNGTEWMRYWQQWYQEDKKEPKCVGKCRIQEACIVACGNSTSTWKECVSHANNKICSLPPIAYTTIYYYYTRWFIRILWISCLVLLLGGALCIFIVRYFKCRKNGFVRAPDIETIFEVEDEGTNNNDIKTNIIQEKNVNDIPHLI